MKSGWKTSEFWLHLLAHVFPIAAAWVAANAAPGSPVATAAVAAVTAVAGHYAAGQYSNTRAALKQAAQDAASAAVASVATPPASK